MSRNVEKSRQVVFVCRSATGESLRSARALARLDRVRLCCISEAGTSVDDPFVDAVQVTNVHEVDQLVQAARTLAEKHGELSNIVTTQETLLDPVARTREALHIRGMSSETVRRTLDKSLLKATLRNAGIPTPPDCTLKSPGDALRFQTAVHLPILFKPLSGSGALATLLIRDLLDLNHAIQLTKPSIERPVLAEAYLFGQELCLDTITIDNEPRLHSICLYYPSILEALEHPETQWTCVMPREMDLYRDFIEHGVAAVRALAVGNSITHMEGFLDFENRLVGFTDATLRPAGARIGPMLGFAYDVDPYRAWARVAVDGCFDGPWERKFAVGTIFLRGSGSGVIQKVDGIEAVNQRLGELLVDARWPTVGVNKSDTYTGDGYITIRHPDTDRVKSALEFIRDGVRISYSEPETSLQWTERFQNYQKLNRPAWEVGGSQ